MVREWVMVFSQTVRIWELTIALTALKMAGVVVSVVIMILPDMTVIWMEFMPILMNTVLIL